MDLQSLFPGDGEMARLCRAHDWAAGSLGAPESWAPALRAAVRTVLESPFAMNLWCGDELVLIYNDAYRTVLGAKHPRALGRPGAEVWAEIWAEIAAFFEQIRTGGPAVFAEDARFLMERAGDAPGEAWFTYSVSPIRTEHGEIVAFLNIAAETTTSVLAQRETQRARAIAESAEHRIRAVFAQAPAFLAVLRGEDHVFEFANDAYMQLVGHRGIIGKAVEEALPEVRTQGFVQILDRVLRTGEPFVGRELAVDLQRVPGGPLEQLYLDFVYQPLTDSAGRRVGIVAHGSNVTAAVASRREVERLLEESRGAHAAAEASEARYRFLADAIPVQVWTATPDGGLDYVSERTAASLGLSVDRILGHAWTAALHPEDVERARERWTHSIETGEPYEIEFRLWSAAHGAHRWHLSRATPQRGADGSIIRWFGTNTDIEDWKRAQAELERLTREALDADRAKSDFLAAMSHDLRTPLNAIGGYAQLIELGVRGPVTEEQKIDLARIQRAKNHLDGLVKDILEFAKLGSGRVELRRDPVPVHTMVASVADLIAPQLAEKNLALDASPVPASLCLEGDEDKVRQIVVNLLSNALKFTPAGGRITVDVGETASTVSIAVTDTGIGIAEDQLERIFEPFVQASQEKLAPERGVGLGLAISRRLALAMRGDLTVQSTPGRGSTFALTLPRAR